MATVKDWSNAARMYGALRGRRGREWGRFVDRADEQFIAPLMAQVREALGEKEYAAAISEGSRLSMAEAMAQGQAWLIAANLTHPVRSCTSTP